MDRILNPKSIYIISHDLIVAGTVATIAAIKAHADVLLTPSRIEAGMTVHISGEDLDLMEQSPDSGLLVMVDRIRKSHGIGVTINFGQWSPQIESLRRGQLHTDVKTDQTASIAANDDATAMTGLKAITNLVKANVAVLVELPVNKSGDTLYMLFTKLKAGAASADILLNNNQQSNAIRFDCLLLESAEVTAYQAIHNEVTADGFWYPVKGQPDA